MLNKIVVLIAIALPLVFLHSAAVEKFLGKWQLTESENFDEYMKTVGVGFFTRKMGALAKPLMTISVDDTGKWTIASESTFKNTNMQFKLGVPFTETTPDGRTMNSTFVLNDEGKLIQYQKKISEDDVDSVFTRYVEGDNLITLCEASGVVSTRTYAREQ
jgi:predicted amidohydrolase